MDPRLEGFIQHGVTFLKQNPDQWQGICPACNKEKFFADPSTALWDCKVCGTSGNFEKFLSLRHAEYMDWFKGEPSIALGKDRGIKPQTFTAWKVGYNRLNQTYSIPLDGNGSRSIKDLHRYKLGDKSKSTSGGKHQIIMPGKMLGGSTLWITEGEWDGMAMWEALKGSQDVMASPGANTFPKHLVGLCSGYQEIILLWDNDDPGRQGAKRTGGLLAGIAKNLLYLHWPQNGKYPDKFGIRKLYQLPEFRKDSKKLLEFLRDNCFPQPPTETPKRGLVSLAGKELSGKGVPRPEVNERYGKWLHLKEHESIDILFGSIFANRLGMDPLWMFLVGPPGSCKTELIMSISDSPDIVTMSDVSAKGLISGSAQGGFDPSLIAKLNEKILCVKDFTLLLSKPQYERDAIFGILRDAYDGRTEKQFGSIGTRSYKVKFGILAGVTNAIEGFVSTSSMLGERFLKYKLRTGGRIHGGEDAIERVLSNLGKETKMREDLSTIGAEVLARKVNPEEIPTLSKEDRHYIKRLAQLIASLRGVVSRDRYTRDHNINFKPSVEIGTRLAKQLAGLALGISIYKQEKKVSAETLETLGHVARDTAPDRVEEIVKQLYIQEKRSKSNGKGYTPKEIGNWTRLGESTTREIMNDLNLLYITQRQDSSWAGLWTLNPNIKQLIEETRLYRKEVHYAREVFSA